MANPYFIEPANPMQALLSGQKGYDYGQEQQKNRARDEAAQQFLAGDQRGAIAKLLATGDVQGATAIAGIQNNEESRKLQERGVALAERQAVDKPQNMIDPNTGQIVRITPGGQASYINPTGTPAAGAGPPIPPGADPKTYRVETSKKLVANEEDALKSAKAAAEFKPLIDQAVEAYKKATTMGAIGPFVGDERARAVNKYTIQSDAEKQRQIYDRALSALQIRISAAQNKGQGQVSNFERQMYAKQFPDLKSLNPEDQVKYLEQIQSDTNQHIAAGSGGALANSPSSQAALNMPSVFNGSSPQSGPPQPGKTVVNGYRYKGGPPNDRNSWVPVQ